MEHRSTSSRHAVILAGGRGTRFWPASRHSHAKQFLAVGGAENEEARSLLTRTWDRLGGSVPIERRWVVCGSDQIDLVRMSLPELPEQNLLAEPLGRNTAACAAWAASAIGQREESGVGGEASFCLLPSDHVIRPEAAFERSLNAAFEVAERERGALVTMGVRPTRPATGFGYIEFGEELDAAQGEEVRQVQRFVEKPELSRAQEFLETGNFLWNAGIFVWRVDSILDAFAEHAPDISRPILKAGSAKNVARIYEELPSRPVDIAILERSSQVRVLPFEHAWNDVGSWSALADVLEADEQGQKRSGGVRVLAEDAEDCLVHGSGNDLVALLGVKGLVVVRAQGSTLVCTKDRAEDVRRIVDRLKNEAPDQL